MQRRHASLIPCTQDTGTTEASSGRTNPESRVAARSGGTVLRAGGNEPSLARFFGSVPQSLRVSSLLQDYQFLRATFRLLFCSIPSGGAPPLLPEMPAGQSGSARTPSVP